MTVLADLVCASIELNEHGARYRHSFCAPVLKSVFPARRGKLLFCLNNGSNDKLQEMEQAAGESDRVKNKQFKTWEKFSFCGDTHFCDVKHQVSSFRMIHCPRSERVWMRRPQGDSVNRKTVSKRWQCRMAAIALSLAVMSSSSCSCWSDTSSLYYLRVTWTSACKFGSLSLKYLTFWLTMCIHIAENLVTFPQHSTISAMI